MKTLQTLFLCLFSLWMANTQAQKLELKKISATDFAKFKTLKKAKVLIPYINKSSNSIKVYKTNQNSESDKLTEKQKPTSNGDKNCAPAEISYKLSSDKLTPVSSTMNIKLGNVFDLNKFRSGNYSAIPYTLLNDGALTIGGGSTSSQVFGILPKGMTNLDLYAEVNKITRGMLTDPQTKQFMVQKMERNFKLIFASSRNQLNANLGVSYSDVTGNVAKLNTKLDISSDSQTYTAFYKEESYSEQLVMTDKIMDSTNPDLVYVSKVIYGRLGFFEYTTTKNLLKFGMDATGGFNYSGAKFSSDLDVSTVKNDESAQMTALLFGNTGTSKLPTSKQEFINWANETPSTNAMVPVGFILSFVDDNSTAYFVTSGSDPVQVCAPKPEGNRKYDVKIKLSHMELKGVCEAPFDDTEDIWGKQAITYLQTIKDGKSVTKVSEDKILWEKADKDGVKNALKDKDVLRINKEFVMTNLTEEEVKNLNIWFGGRMYDYEPTGSPRYNCKNCSEPQENPFKAKFRVRENPSTIKAIDELIKGADYVDLETGNEMTLVYKECSSTINVIYKLQVKSY